MNSRFTLNYGLRLEHEDGLREINNRQTVAFDQNVVNPIDALVPKAGTLLAGKTLQGRLDLRRRQRRAGAAGQSEDDQAGAARRRDLRGRLQDGDSRRLRAVLGAVELQHDRAWPDRLLADDAVQPVGAGERSAARHAGQPVPGRTAGADRQLAGAARPTSAARSTSSIRTRATRRSISTRSTSSASCPARWRSPSATSARPGATSASAARTTARPATSTSTRSIRRSRGSCSRSAAAGMRRSCASRFPIRSSASRRRVSSARASTIPRGQLLRPFPEFGDVLMHESTDGSKRQYQRRVVQARQAAERRAELVGRPLQLHVEPLEGQPVRREQHLRVEHATAAEQLRPRTPSTAPASTTRRTGSSWRRSSGCPGRRTAAASPTRWPADGTRRRSSRW